MHLQENVKLDLTETKEVLAQKQGLVHKLNEDLRIKDTELKKALRDADLVRVVRPRDAHLSCGRSTWTLGSSVSTECDVFTTYMRVQCYAGAMPA